jgi:predicted aspartyl protease
LLLCLLLAPLTHAQTFRVPFHSVNGMILLDATVNDKPAALLLDTGADFTLISPEAAGGSAKLDALKATNTTGANGEYVKARVDLRLAERHWIERTVLVMDLSEAGKRLGTRIDGFIGQDVLREFSALRIDFKASVVEFEK